MFANVRNAIFTNYFTDWIFRDTMANWATWWAATKAQWYWDGVNLNE